MDETSPWWNSPALAALDLEGTGPQDPQGETILEIAVVPVHEGRPIPSESHSTLINPERPIQRRPWISPGLTNDVLSKAPSAQDVGPRLAALLDGKIIVGHNVRVDWRLLHRHYPEITPAGLLDTLRLARALNPSVKGHSLTAWLERRHLTGATTEAAPGSQPHRALWDATGTAMLLSALLDDRNDITMTELLKIAGLPAETSNPAPADEQPTLWDL
ncbi:3'-5' exonuclease [Streptomyces sp. NPDC057654]|uniref:3'-5' exonuclease n=1 Tax=Streptomyces sp. NPDC057654 TaxID=3346196 RepID=UPI0036AD48AC